MALPDYETRPKKTQTEWIFAGIELAGAALVTIGLIFLGQDIPLLPRISLEILAFIPGFIQVGEAAVDSMRNVFDELCGPSRNSNLH